jgi:hypothetical protein
MIARKATTPDRWLRIDYDWSTYWSNGPDEIKEALHEPLPPPSSVRTLEDMTPEEIEALEELYSAPVSCRELLPAFRS